MPTVNYLNNLGYYAWYYIKKNIRLILMKTIKILFPDKAKDLNEQLTKFGVKSIIEHDSEWKAIFATFGSIDKILHALAEQENLDLVAFFHNWFVRHARRLSQR